MLWLNSRRRHCTHSNCNAASSSTSTETETGVFQAEAERRFVAGGHVTSDDVIVVVTRRKSVLALEGPVTALSGVAG